MQHALAACFGAFVGLSLGMTGGGGSIFAVPLLVYGLGQPPGEAVVVSLASVGATSLIGTVRHWLRGGIETRAGVILAAGGIAGAPLGVAIGHRVDPSTTLALFAIIMFVVAVRMWLSGGSAEAAAFGGTPESGSRGGPSCRHNPAGRLSLTSRCFAVLAVVGAGSGILSGWFGVGGGFVIVPALVMLADSTIQRAAATSLFVIALVSVPALAANLSESGTVNLPLIGLFTSGSVGGLFAGVRVARLLSPRRLQRTFAGMILLAGAVVMIKNLL